MVDIMKIVDISNKNKRDRTYDFLKLYAMLSVVLDHSLQRWIGGDIQRSQLYNWIFLTQMPIFMFVSGYFSVEGIYQNLTSNNYVRKIRKIIKLLIPFVTFTIISSIIASQNMLIKSFLHPDYSLWFLWALMWIQLILSTAQWLAEKISKRIQERLFFSMVLYAIGLIPVIILYLWKSDLFGTKLIIYYSLFIMFGYVYSYIDRIARIYQKDKFRAVCIPLLFGIVVFVMIKHPMLFFDNESIINMIYRLVGSFCATMMMVYISSFAVKIKLFERVAAFGVLSLEMYYVHLLILKVTFLNRPTMNARIFVFRYLLLIVVALVIIFILKSNAFTDFIFFGKIRKRQSKN